MTKRAGRAGAGVLGVLLLATGCGQDPAPPTTLPPVTPSTTPSASPSASAAPPSPTTTPGQLDEASRAEAEAFVEEFWGVVNAVLVGEWQPERVRDFYQSTCASCEEIYDDLVAARENGGRLEGGEQRIVSTDYEARDASSVLVRSAVQPQPGRSLDGEGEVIEEYDGGPIADFVFNLAQSDDGWVIQDLLALGPRS